VGLSLALICGVGWCATPLFAQARDRGLSIGELKKLSIGQLSNVEVSSVSRTEETLGGAAAAVAVLTSEDIRRSGATTVPETLRMIPGLHVARQTSSSWAISSRGFSNSNSEKLLVLTDTRSLYTPLYSGVFWSVQDYMLQDIDRIEVIRGPGATLWGSNAVNGVINITTKNAKDTQGLYVDTSVGNEERSSTAARYGGRVGDTGYYRVFGQYAGRSSTFHPADPNQEPKPVARPSPRVRRAGSARRDRAWRVREAHLGLLRTPCRSPLLVLPLEASLQQLGTLTSGSSKLRVWPATRCAQTSDAIDDRRQAEVHLCHVSQS
jgi:outer membrane receptor protein involved in Fe transport